MNFERYLKITNDFLLPELQKFPVTKKHSISNVTHIQYVSARKDGINSPPRSPPLTFMNFSVGLISNLKFKPINRLLWLIGKKIFVTKRQPSRNKELLFD